MIRFENKNIYFIMSLNLTKFGAHEHSSIKHSSIDVGIYFKLKSREFESTPHLLHLKKK